VLGSRVAVVEVPELFSGKEIRPHIGHHAFHSRLVPSHQLRSIPSLISELFG
jgi:hypothetical protein